ncbi:MAG: CusA/CzcA family heavy metal efflux RND transporter [Acidobacteriia bacterium]|nr:CusA/CzcA family heavy metal efflux RND transporter [Terriglobia bacterium]
MKTFVNFLLRYRVLFLLALVAWVGAGIYFFIRLDIEAYPDPSPPLVEVITQNPSWSAEEMERQITVPIETTLFGMPHLQYVRSISLFGLSDVKLYFDYESDYTQDRQEVINRLQFVSLPPGIAAQISPWSPIGEIYRYKVEGAGYSLNELKATQDWLVRREIKQVPGIIDITTYGGTTRQYQAEVDPSRLLQYNITLPQLLAAVNASNANAGGNYLSQGSQSVNVRGIGLLRNIEEMKSVVVAARNGVPVFLRDVAEVHEGFQPRLGRAGMDEKPDVVEGVVLLQRGEQSIPALAALRAKIDKLNRHILPAGMKIRAIYDRTALIQRTTRTVREIVLFGLGLLTVLLILFLGDLRISFIAALSVPLAVLFAFMMLVLTHASANLISIGAIDFGILVDVSVIEIEHIHRRLCARGPDEPVFAAIAEAMAEASRPVFFSVAVILVAFLPLFTMTGVPGRIFAPMSITYGYALVGACLFALFLAPVLASWGVAARRAHEKHADETHLVRWIKYHYERKLPWLLQRRRLVLTAALLFMAASFALFPFIGGEFMPKLEEGNLWIRATLPQDVSFEAASRLSDRIRGVLRDFPEVTTVVSQMGRPDDGTDVTTFNNIEFFTQLKPAAQWPSGLTKPQLIDAINARFAKIPGVDFNFSQNIQDNVEEAMSGVKGENSLKLFGEDIDVLVAKAAEIHDVMAAVPGVTDLAVFQETGQPQLLVSIDRAASARYGLMAADVNAAVQAAIGGQAVTQILEGDRRFDFVVRYKPEFRQSPEAIRNILLPTPDGGRVPLAQVAQITQRPGAFMIYRENGRRYIPIKFSVRGRDLAGTMAGLEDRLAQRVHLPPGYDFEWAGEYESLKKEERRLGIIIPVSLVIITAILHVLFTSLLDALITLSILPFAATGGLIALFVTRTPFSISAAVGFTSAIGVTTLATSVFLSGIRRLEKKGLPRHAAVLAGAMIEVRPILLACLAAGLGLLPAAVSSGIGAQAQQPLARVVVGSMLTATLAILFLVPIFAGYQPPRETPAASPDA